MHVLARLAAGLLLVLLVPSASAAFAHLPLEPGDAVQATDGPSERELQIESLFGRQVVIVSTAEPAVVAVQVSHSDGSLSTHVLQTVGTDAELRPLIDAQAEAIAAIKLQVTNLSATVASMGDSVAQQRVVLDQALIELNATIALLDATGPQLDRIQAAANEANLAIRNFRVPEPDYSPITSDMESHAKELEERLGRLQVLLVFTLMAAAGALLHAGWQVMGGKRPDLSRLRDWVRKPMGDQREEPAIPEDARAASEALAAEFLPSESEDVVEDVPSGGDEPEGSAPAAIPLQDERLAKALHVEGGLPQQHGSH